MAAIAVGADNAGAPLKEHLARYLQERGYEVKEEQPVVHSGRTLQERPEVPLEAGI